MSKEGKREYDENEAKQQKARKNASMCRERVLQTGPPKERKRKSDDSDGEEKRSDKNKNREKSQTITEDIHSRSRINCDCL